MGIIKIDHLNFSYNNKLFLKDINLSFEKGKITGILGANGSGKSTLLKNIISYLKPASGAILIKFKNIKDYNPKELADIFGFVPQKSEINTPLTVLDVIYMGRVSKIKNNFLGFAKHDKEKVEEIIQQLDLKALIDKSVFTISGGEFQRVLLARALVQEPTILLLDESTAHLDMKYALDITNLISKLVKNTGLTCILILHDLNLAGMYCDNIVFLKKGEVKYVGPTAELFKMEVLKDIYGFHCQIINNKGCPYVLPTKL
ncbi:ABC transporter ATP-binding protein [Candidatus Hepatincolaceae symbiont of Richtersius coronifer]